MWQLPPLETCIYPEMYLSIKFYKHHLLYSNSLGSNVIGSEGFGVAALADTLRVNKSLKALK